MKKSNKLRTGGYTYSLTEETIAGYQEKPIELRLKWLYMGNLLRMSYDKKTIKAQDRLREGKNP